MLTVLGVIAGAVAWAITTIIAFEALASSRRTTSTAVMYSTIVGTYVDPPPFPTPLNVSNNGRETSLQNLRAARLWAKDYEVKDPDGWERRSADFRTEGGFCCENRAAYMIANSLNDLGGAVITGGASLSSIIGTVGDVVIDDWLASRHWISAYRKRENVSSLRYPQIAYHRRYGEWLALLTLIVFEKQWSYLPGKRMAKQMTKSDLRGRFLVLTSVDRKLLPLNVHLDLLRILPISLKIQIIFSL